LFATTCYALGDTKRPARYAVVRVVVSTILALLLMSRFGVVGVVIGATTAAWFEALLLGWQLRRTIGGLGLDKLQVGHIAGLAGACNAVPVAARHALPGAFAQGVLGSLTVLTVLGLAFLAAARALGLFDLRDWLHRRG